MGRPDRFGSDRKSGWTVHREPVLEQREASDMHLVVSGTKEAIMMVEAGAQEVPEEDYTGRYHVCT